MQSNAVLLLSPYGQIVHPKVANQAGTLPTAIVRADVSPYGQPKLTLIEHSGILKLASQTNGQVVGQIEEKPDHTALFITNRTAGSRQQ